MHILVKTLTGKSLTLNVEPTCEISELNSQIESSMGVPSEDQILICNGKSLSGNLIDSELTEESEIYMVVDIEGGKKKCHKARGEMFVVLNNENECVAIEKSKTALKNALKRVCSNLSTTEFNRAVLEL